MDAVRVAEARRGFLALTVIVGCQFVLVVDASIVNVALPSIRGALGFDAAGLSWVVNAYTLAFGGLMLLGARAGDILGHRKLLVAGALVFTVASLLGGLALTPGWLLAARALQGAGAALAGPASLALIATTFAEGPARARALSWFAISASVGMVAGFILGGVLTELVSWRWVLFVTVPVGAAIAGLAPYVIRESAPQPGRFDLPGALTSTVGMTLLVYGFIRAAGTGWGDPGTLAAFAAALTLLGVFLAVEVRARQPIMPLTLWSGRDRVGAYAMRLVLSAAMVGMLFFLTLYVQTILGYGPLATGFAFLPTTLALVAASRAVARFIPRYGPGPPMVTGSLLCAAGMVWLTQAGPDSTYAGMVLGPVVLFGGGTGLVAVAATFVAMSSARPEESGATSGLLQSMQQVGGSLGVAMLVTVYGLTAGPPLRGMTAAFTAGTVLTVAMVAVSLAAFRRRR